MSIEHQNTTSPAVNNEAAIKQAADQLIREAAAKHGMTFEQVPEEAKQDAYNFAKASVEAQQAEAANPVYAQLQAEREAHRLTQLQLDAVKQTRVSVGNNVPSGPNPEIVRAQLGEGNWRALTDNGRLQACGINPATVTTLDLQEAQRVFGRKMDSHYSANLSKQDWTRYKHLKNIAIIMSIAPGKAILFAGA